MLAIPLCNCMVSFYLPPLSAGSQDRDNLVVRYFELGFSYKEILAFLGARHNIRISLRHLKRILSSKNCYRRKNHSNIREVVDAVEKELDGSGGEVGYRHMHQRLLIKYKLVASRETVRKTIAALDPEGVRQRSMRRFRHRVYSVRGPNDMWHIDGYDKLKPFGFAIHGAIDGYSRRILWLHVGRSNNDPRIVAQYFVDYIRGIRGTARRIRADFGTENTHVAQIQRFLRRNNVDSFAKEKSFVYGKSVANQRIESWWSFQRRWGINWWINYFKDLRDRGNLLINLATNSKAIISAT